MLRYCNYMFDNIKNLLTKPWVNLCIIGILCFLIYVPNLTHEFVYDDQSFFINWETPRSFSNIGKFFAGDLPEGHEHVYRPIRSVFYAIDYTLFKDNPIGYHLQGILINLIIAFLAYLIVMKLTKNTYTAFAAGILFGLHPSHTEAITFATASMDSIAFIFAFGAFYLFICSEKVLSRKFLFSLFFSLLSFLTYEITLVLPLLILAYTCYFRSRKNSIRQNVSRVTPFFLLLIIYGVLRFFVGYVSPALKLNLMQYIYMLVTTLKIFYQYFTILLVPFPLTLDHSVSNQLSSLRVLALTPEFTSQPLFDIHSFTTALITLILATIAILTYKKQRIISFSISWLYISLLPVSNIIPNGSLFAERYVFLASFGYCMILGFLLTQPFKTKNFLVSTLVLFRPYLLTILIASYALLTLIRNNDWTNGYTLWTSTVKTSGYSASAWNNLGIVYSDRGRNDVALKYYKKALKIDPYHAFAYTNMGLLYYENGDYDKAIALYKTALVYNPGDLTVLKDIAFAESKQIASQQQSIIRVKSIANSQTQDSYIRQERSLLNQGQIDQALGILEKAIKEYPGNITYLNDAAAIYNSKGNTQKSTEYLDSAIKLDPTDPSLYFNLAILMEREGRNTDAFQTLKFSLKLDPHFQEAKDAIDQLETKGYH